MSPWTLGDLLTSVNAFYSCCCFSQHHWFLLRGLSARCMENFPNWFVSYIHMLIYRGSRWKTLSPDLASLWHWSQKNLHCTSFEVKPTFCKQHKTAITDGGCAPLGICYSCVPIPQRFDRRLQVCNETALFLSPSIESRSFEDNIPGVCQA